MSASDPYSVECVLDGSRAAKDRISSLAIHGEKVYVGSPTGALSVYRLPPASASLLSPDSSGFSVPGPSSSDTRPSPQAILVSNQADFHPLNRPVLNLRIIPSLSLVLSLCSDGALHFNHLATLEPVSTPQVIASQVAKAVFTFEVQTSIVDWPKDDLSASDLPASTSSGSRTFRGTRLNDNGRTPRGANIVPPARNRPISMYARQNNSKSDKPSPNFRLITTLVVSVRRKLLILRWLDGEPWDYNEVPLPHSPRSLALSPSHAPSTSGSVQAQKQSCHVFMSYGTPNDFALIEIPAASTSSVYHQQMLAQAAGEKRKFLRNEKQVGKLRDLTIPAYSVEQSQHGDASPDARTNSPARDARVADQSAASKPTAAPSTAGLLSGLGGYIGLGSRSKVPFLRAVPFPSPSKDHQSQEVQSQDHSETEILLVRDNTAVFLSASTGNPTRRRGLDWSASVEDVAMLPSQHLFAALPHSASSPSMLQIRSTKNLDVVQNINLPFSSTSPNSSPHYTISMLLAPPSQSSSASASSTLYAVVTPTSAGHEAAHIYKLTPRPWKARLKEMVRQRMWEAAIELVKDGITESEIEADDSTGLAVGADVKKALLKPLLALLSLDRFLVGCAAHSRKQSAAANAAFEEAVDTWIDLDLNPAKVLSIFPEHIAGNGLSRPRKEWTKIWGEELAREGFALDDVETDRDAPRLTMRAQHTSRRGSMASIATGNSVPTGAGGAIARDRSRLASLFGRASRPTSMLGEPSSSPTPRKESGTVSAKLDISGQSTPLTGNAPAAEGDTRGRTKTRSASPQDEGMSPPPESTKIEVKSVDDNSVPTSASPSVKDVEILPSEAGAFELTKASLEALGRFLADRRRIFKPILEARPRVVPAPISSVISLPSIPLSKMSIEELTALAQVVDTALFKTFLETKPSLVGPLCRIENWCEVTEVEEILEAKGKHSELISLYGGKAMHDKALNLLRKFAQDEDDEDEKVGPTIRYLQNLGPEHIDVILKYAQWVLKQDRQRGMEIFTADAGKVSLLPRLDVVKLLSSFDPDLCAQYLEHIIHDVGEGSPEIHERLASIYLDRVLSAPSSATLQKEYHERLHDFLYDSQQYRPERILSRVPPDSLWDIRAVLLGRMGQHKGALSIYVERIGGKEGEEKAEDYCIEVFENSQSGEEGKNIFLLLLKLYLQHNTQPGSLASREGDDSAVQQALHDLEPALRLISNHAARLDLSAVLDLLPPMIPISSIRPFLVKGLQSSHRQRFDRHIVASIGKERNLQLDEKVNALRGRRVKITQGRTCPVCGKRLGVSVLSVSHRGEVLHYGCRQDQQQQSGHATGRR